MKKAYITTALLLILSQILYAQNSIEKKSIFTISSDLVSSYLWRGEYVDNLPNIQSSINIRTANNRLALGVWTSSGIVTDFVEIDFYASYTYTHLTLSIYDYFATENILNTEEFFNYDSKSTNHALEAFLTLGGFKIPLQIGSGIYFYGNDRNEENENYYSIYITAEYEFELNNNKNLNLFFGATPRYGIYADNAAIINLGCSITKTINISKKASIPLSGTFIFNPYTEQVFYVFGFSVQINS